MRKPFFVLSGRGSRYRWLGSQGDTQEYKNKSKRKQGHTGREREREREKQGRERKGEREEKLAFFNRA
jgi:hypothetical protein